MKRKLSNSDNEMLIAPFTETVWDYDSAKSSSLDRFNFRFVKDFCSISKADFFTYVGRFSSSWQISMGINPNFHCPNTEEGRGLYVE